MTQIVKSELGHSIVIDGVPYAVIPACAGATDTFEVIEGGAWRWHRHTESPTDHMRMEMILLGDPTFTMVPSISYNGNGWGNMPEYVGDRAEEAHPGAGPLTVRPFLPARTARTSISALR